MPSIALDAGRPLPKGLRIAGSVAIIAHLSIFAALAIGAQSGPWYTPMGPSNAIGPQFVKPINDLSYDNYLNPLRMTHNYHFNTNQPSNPGVYFEVTLRDDKGQLLSTLKFPDPKANPWVRHRQALLAQALAQDQPVRTDMTERLAGKGQKLPDVTYWHRGPDQFTLKKVPEHQLPRDFPPERPSEWSQVMAQSYMRYLCRQNRAASAELVRHLRPAILPAYLFIPELPPDAFSDMISNFGEYRRDQ